MIKWTEKDTEFLKRNSHEYTKKELDRIYWHYNNGQNEKKDLQKNQAILDKKWKFIRILDNNVTASKFEKIKYQVIYLIKNVDNPEFQHTGGFYI